MIEYQTLADDHPDLLRSPLLRAALLTLRYTQEHGSIGTTKSKAFKRTFVHWAVQNFDWPGEGADEVFRYHKVVNEADFAPRPGSVMIFVYLVWPMRVLDTVTH